MSSPMNTTMLMDPSTATPFVPDVYVKPQIIDFIRGLPRYGFTNDISDYFSEDKSAYIKGIILSSFILLLFLLAWCLLLLAASRFFPSKWISGYIEPPFESEDDETSSTHETDERQKDRHIDRSHDKDDESHCSNNDSDENESEEQLSVDSSIFWRESDQEEKELSMAIIAREQKADRELKRKRRRHPQNYSKASNGKIELVTMRDCECDHDDASAQFNQSGRNGDGFCVYIPYSLRLKLLRTYHDHLIHPDEKNNPDTLIYQFFTWQGIRQDVQNYVQRYRESMHRGSNAALVTRQRYDDDCYDDDGNTIDTYEPVTLDVIAAEQAMDIDIERLMEKAPFLFSTATNGDIQLITARGKDKKYRIVIPRKLQPKVLKTYHECLIYPTPDNNFENGLYAHFTWNGIHEDVEEYVREQGLTDEMKRRDSAAFRKKEERKMRIMMRERDREGNCIEMESGKKKRLKALSPRSRIRKEDERRIESTVLATNRRSDHSSEQENELDNVVDSYSSDDSEYSSYTDKPIGLDEIAKEQKKDRELRRLKREEPFVFSTVRYGRTLLTTAQNFRDNKYRIVIPRSLQGRMLLTYKQYLLNPTPESNFDTLLYNHFTWNGIHEDVEYFVKSNGRLPKKDDDNASNSSDNIISPLRLVMGQRRSKSKCHDFSSAYHNRGDKHSDDEDYGKQSSEREDFQRKIKRIRIAFLLSGFCMITSSILFFEKGITLAYQSLHDARDGLKLVAGTANKALNVSQQYLTAQSDIQTIAKQIGTYNISTWCAANEGNDFAIQVYNKTYSIGVNLRSTALKVELEVKNLESDIKNILVKVSDAESALIDIHVYITVVKVIAIIIDIIVVSLMIGCILAWMEIQHLIPLSLGKLCVFPVFMLLLLLFWIFMTSALMAAMAGADFCSMPNESMLHIMLENQDKVSPFVFISSLYYITGCLSERIPTTLVSLKEELSSIGELVQNTADKVVVSLSQSNLAEVCGSDEGPSKLVEVLELVHTSIDAIKVTLSGVMEVLQCQNLNPVYTTFAYDAVCRSGVGGLSWVFLTSLSMSIFSMLMITLRVAIYQY